MTTKPGRFVFDSPFRVAEAAAERLVRRVSKVEPASVCLTGGSTSKLLYELLSSPAWRARIPWERIHWFMGDERAVPEDNDLSNGGMARRSFLDGCAPPSNIHLMSIDNQALDDVARAYERELLLFRQRYRTRGPLFLVLLGVGSDGHVASLFPGTIALDETQRWVVAIPRAGVAPFVPRISLTLPCLASTQEILFLVTGHGKQDILSRVFANENLPANRTQPFAGETTWFIDDAAKPAHF
jgi:6-phosphogluconolactonase